MDWKAEKMCSSRGNYELLVERTRQEYHCENASENWKWHVIHSGVIVAKGISGNMTAAQAMAESNIPAGA